MNITESVMEIAASIEKDIPSKVGGSNRVFIRAVIARAIMAEREACAQHLEDIAKASPLGDENIQRGKSTYNWLTHAASLIRNRP